MAFDGFDLALDAITRGLRPDPELDVAAWAEENIFLPRGNAAEHGQYRVSRTPFAKKVMDCLSPTHPCKRVVVKAASQLLKTQTAINWLLGSIDLAPDNMIVLMPTLPLARRVSTRFGKAIDACEPVRAKVAPPRSRDKSNTIASKDFDGGTLHITTAGSAANLAEIPARYLYCDEVSRWDGDVDGEGDPIKVADARLSTHERDRKAFYTSSPLIEGRCRIDRLYQQGTQNEAHVPCPHCGEHHKLEWENMHWPDDDGTVVCCWMVCPSCGAVIEESDKPRFLTLEHFRWVETAAGDGETESFELSALYAPLGWVSWLSLVREYVEAKQQQDAGNPGPMQVFENTRLARCWKGDGTVVSTTEALMARAEKYAEWTVPARGLVLTAGVDVQGDRLAVSVWAWGAGEEGWLVFWGELEGKTIQDHQGAWKLLEEFILNRTYLHASGAQMNISRMTVDTGDGNASQDAAYSFCRRNKQRGVLAGKGDSERGVGRRDIFSAPKPSIDANRKNKAWKYGLQPYIIGTSAAKDLLIEARLPMEGNGPGHLHWYANVRVDWYDQVLAEVKVASRRLRGRKVWECKTGVRNEGLDTLVYAFHAARSLKINLWKPATWEALELRLRQGALLAPTAVEPITDAATDTETPPQGLPAEVAAAADQPAPTAGGSSVADPVVAAAPVVAIAVPRPKAAARPPVRRPGGFSVNRW